MLFDVRQFELVFIGFYYFLYNYRITCCIDRALTRVLFGKGWSGGTFSNYTMSSTARVANGVIA